MKFYDFFSLFLSLITAFFTIKQKAIRWPIDIAIILLNLVIHHKLRLYDRWILTFGIILLDIYGWINWHRKEKHNDFEIQLLSFKKKILISVFGAVSIVLFYFFLKYIKSDFPFLGSIRTILTWLAIFLASKKKQENWIIWVFLNIMAIYIYYKKHYFIFIIKYSIYIILNIYAFFVWKQYIKK